MPADVPPPVGAAALTAPAVLSSKGLSKEEVLRQQLNHLHEDYEGRLESAQAELARCRKAAADAAAEASELRSRLAAACGEREEARAEAGRASVALDECRRSAASAAADHKAQVLFYRDYIKKLDELAAADGGVSVGEEAEGDGVTSPSPQTPPPDPATSSLRAEFERKEAEMSVEHLSRQVTRLKAELRAVSCDQADKELEDHNTRLQESVQQLEESLVQQQDLRRDLQQEYRKTMKELSHEKQLRIAAEDQLRSVSGSSSVVEELKLQLRAATSEQSRLQHDLAASQQRGLAAQRQLDELTSSDSAQRDLAELRDKCSRLEAALAAQAEMRKADGQQRGSSRTASPEGGGRSVEALERELAERASALQLLSEAADAAREAAESASAACSAKEQMCSELTDRCGRLEQELAKERGQVSNARLLLEMKAEELGVSRAALKEAQQQAEDGQASMREQRERHASALQGRTAERDEAVSKLQEAEAARDGLNRELRQLRASALTQTAQAQAQEAICATLRIAADAAQREKEDLRRQVESLQADVAAVESASRDQSEAHAAEVRSLRQVSADLSAELEGRQEESEWLQRQLASVRREKAAVDTQRLAALADVADAQTRRQDLEIRLADAAAEMRKLRLEHRTLRQEVGGGVDALVPLPDHTALPAEGVLELVEGGLESCRCILASVLQSCATGPRQGGEAAWRAKLDEESSFTVALVKKLNDMLQDAAAKLAADPSSAPPSLDERRKRLLASWRQVAESSAKAVAAVQERIEED
eukprot:TRINITY_DN8157_c0_g2_i1.p1 TRINITY_DN8157_c0_g2~~TRINITY_DN8157_c0_g2_i1.p1  ORF type:complete len:799 (+),score=361.41 TRINITY_DN8157_c0_g2_i1:88-2397(+)